MGHAAIIQASVRFAAEYEGFYVFTRCECLYALGFRSFTERPNEHPVPLTSLIGDLINLWVKTQKNELGSPAASIGLVSE